MATEVQAAAEVQTAAERMAAAEMVAMVAMVGRLGARAEAAIAGARLEAQEGAAVMEGTRPT